MDADSDIVPVEHVPSFPNISGETDAGKPGVLGHCRPGMAHGKCNIQSGLASELVVMNDLMHEKVFALLDAHLRPMPGHLSFLGGQDQSK